MGSREASETAADNNNLVRHVEYGVVVGESVVSLQDRVGNISSLYPDT